MADLSLPWGTDLGVDETGDLAFVTGTAELAERVVRRFLTSAYQAPGAYLPSSPPDYIYDGSYGGSARLYVDRRVNQSEINAIQQLFLAACNAEAEVSQTTPPVVTCVYTNGALYLSASVTLANNQVALIPTLELT